MVINFKKQDGFTLIELIVVIVIIAILSGIIMFAVSQYISKGKDSNISGNLAILIPAGEVFYNVGNNYDGFCNPGQNGNSAMQNAIRQMPQNPAGACPGGDISDPDDWTSTANPAGICCYAESQAWAACVKKFTDSNSAYCVDSRGIKKEITNTQCLNSVGVSFKCP